jgi:hypothetical protein
VSNLHINIGNLEFREYYITDSEVNGIYADSSWAFKPSIKLNNCLLRVMASGYTNAPIGWGTSGNLNYTEMIGCKIASNFDLTLVHSFIGCNVHVPTASPLLPSGVTKTLLFTGWRGAGLSA